MNIRLNALTLSLAAIGLTSGLIGCGSGGAPDDLTVTTPVREPITAKYKYQFAFVNALDDKPITDTLTVTFTGASVDNGEIVDPENTSVKGKTYTTSTGVFAAAANFDLVADGDVFTVLAGNLSKGWNTSGTQILKTTSKEGIQTITIKLTNSSASSVTAINADTSLGIAMVTDTATASAGGVIASDKSLATAAKSVTTVEGTTEPVGTAKIFIPAGTVAKDASGTPASGSLKLTVTKYSNAEADALAAFPGGFAPAATTSTGSTTTGPFVTGGFAQFNVTDSTGKAIKNFDTPIQLTIDLPKTSKHPSTGVTVKAGDTYPVWSFDEVTGKWKFETNGTIAEKTPVDTNNFQVSFSSNHLSYWNLDFFDSQVPNCTGTVNIVGRPAGDTRPLNVDIVGSVGNRFQRTLYRVTDSTQTLNYAPNLSVALSVTDSKGRPVGSATDVNMCATGGATVNISLPTITVAPLTVNVTESCSDSVRGIRPSPTWVYFYADGTWYSGYTTNTGTVSTISFSGIEAGTAGTLYTYNPYKDQYELSQVTVAAPSTTKAVNFPNLACTTGATGSGAF